MSGEAYDAERVLYGVLLELQQPGVRSFDPKMVKYS
jgi:hypothetical protein